MAMVNLKEFNLEALTSIDGGRVRIAVDSELERVVRDIDDRPGVKAARVINIQIAVVPVQDVQSGIAEQAQIQCQVESKIPKRKTKVWEMNVRKGGKLLYRPDGEEDVEQNLDFGESNR